MPYIPVITEMFLQPELVQPGMSKRSPWLLGRKKFCRGKTGRGKMA